MHVMRKYNAKPQRICIFFLFPNLQIWLGEKRFSSDREVIAAMDEYFIVFETSYFSEGIKKFEER